MYRVYISACINIMFVSAYVYHVCISVRVMRHVTAMFTSEYGRSRAGECLACRLVWRESAQESCRVEKKILI